MCWPHPAQVVLWQVAQVTGRHIEGLQSLVGQDWNYTPQGTAPFSDMRGQKLIMWPPIPCAASLIASDSVGCACTALAISSAVRS